MSRLPKSSNSKSLRPPLRKPRSFRKPPDGSGPADDPLAHVTHEVITADRLIAMSKAMRQTPHGLIPDWPARLSAMRLILAYVVGLPASRLKQMPSRKTTDKEVFDDALKKSTTRRAIRDYLDFIERNEAEESALLLEPSDNTQPDQQP